MLFLSLCGEPWTPEVTFSGSDVQYDTETSLTGNHCHFYHAVCPSYILITTYQPVLCYNSYKQCMNVHYHDNNKHQISAGRCTALLPWNLCTVDMVEVRFRVLWFFSLLVLL
jgi:hypothetical protein